MDCVDIILATYNGEKYIDELLNSILEQTYKNIRILVCDDCSTDKTYKILKKYQNKGEIILYKNETNTGSVRTFEYLLGKVESKYFMFADQDDVWYKDKVEQSLQLLIEEEADMIFTDLEVVDQKLRTLNKSFNKMMKYERNINKFIYDRIYFRNFV